jgi:hypothetical protein
MKFQEAIKTYFTRESIVEILTSYELSYQISLGNFVFETIQDIEEANQKIKELNLKPTINHILSNIYELILHHSQVENFENKFEHYIRQRATIHALKDFVNTDKELVSINDYIEQKSELIAGDEYFTENMYLQFESSYATIHEYFDLMISDELALKLQDSFIEK